MTDFSSWRTSDLRAELGRIEQLSRDLSATVTDADVTRLDGIIAELERRQAGERHDVDRAARIRDLEEGVRSGRYHLEPAVGPLDEGGTSGHRRDAAFRAIERADGASDDQREGATRLVERGLRGAADYVTAVADPHYRSAWWKAAANPATGHLAFTRPEAEAWQRTLQVRAMSLTDAAGGYAVPFTLDPTFIVSNTGTTNPLRTIARTVQTVTDQWAGVTTAGVTASFDAEAAEVSDDAPTLAQPAISVHKAQAFVPFSIEAGMDIPAFDEEIRTLFADAKDRLEATKFTLGSGTGEPKGIVTALTGTASVVASAGANVFAVADVYALLEALPPRHRPGASWCAPLTIINECRKFATGTGPQHAFVADLTAGQPPVILGKPLYEASDMDGTYGAGENYVLCVGDFREFVIVDRIGMTVELVPHLFATANNRPSGQRGLYAYWRTGSDVSHIDAFRLLNVT